MNRCAVDRWIPGADRIASIASAAGIGRMLTTILPPKGPALSQSIWVRYIGTLTPSLMFLISMPAAISASSRKTSIPGQTPPSHPARDQRYRVAARSARRHARHDTGAHRFEYRCRFPAGAVRIPGLLADCQQWAGLGVERAERFKMRGVASGEDHDIALHIARCQAGGLLREVCRPAPASDFMPRHGSSAATILVSNLYSAYESYAQKRVTPCRIFLPSPPKPRSAGIHYGQLR